MGQVASRSRSRFLGGRSRNPGRHPARGHDRAGEPCHRHAQEAGSGHHDALPSEHDRRELRVQRQGGHQLLLVPDLDGCPPAYARDSHLHRHPILRARPQRLSSLLQLARVQLRARYEHDRLLLHRLPIGREHSQHHPSGAPLSHDGQRRVR